MHISLSIHPCCYMYPVWAFWAWSVHHWFLPPCHTALFEAKKPWEPPKIWGNHYDGALESNVESLQRWEIEKLHYSDAMYRHKHERLENCKLDNKLNGSFSTLILIFLSSSMTPTASDLQLVYQRGCIRIIPPGPGKQPEVAARHVAKTKLSEAKNHSWDILAEYMPEKIRGNKNTHTADPSLSTAAPPSCTGRQNRCKQKPNERQNTIHPIG